MQPSALPRANRRAFLWAGSREREGSETDHAASLHTALALRFRRKSSRRVELPESALVWCCHPARARVSDVARGQGKEEALGTDGAPVRLASPVMGHVRRPQKRAQQHRNPLGVCLANQRLTQKGLDGHPFPGALPQVTCDSIRCDYHVSGVMRALRVRFCYG